MTFVLFRALMGIRMLAQRVREEVGQDTLEWAMLSGLVAIAIVGVTLLLTDALESLITGIGNCIDFDGATACMPGGVF